jgi:PPOX class probable F420-dependent enzyme
MDIAKAVASVKANPRSVIATRRKDGGVQMSPVLVAVDDDDSILVSSRETAYKVRNMRRDPHVWLCVLNEGFFGDWLQIDGTAEIVSLPEAMDVLIDYYRRLQGEHPDWDEYRQAMRQDKRVIVRITIERAGPDRAG